MNNRDRYRGCLLGLACGDAVGTTVEFMPRGTFEPVTQMAGGGPFGLQPGEWTDDTSMALCLATSIVRQHGFDAVDQMNRYCNWRSVGYLSSNGECFDIGITVATALDRYLRTRDPFAGDPDPKTAGNGALMRLAPVPMYFRASAADTLRFAGESTRTTHGAQEAIDCSRLFALQLRAALLGARKENILATVVPGPLSTKVAAIASGSYRGKPREAIKGSGYCVDSLEAALWCFSGTELFEEAVLAAANLGDDADTTAAICGQLAGAHYGTSAIPQGWLEKLAMRGDIELLADLLMEGPHSS
ncbi:ADP-ribosylglycohydrolase family protein [Variovorax paradoxus]|uniref:ADP-ribosylglycohydrolase family protein n=1 Tax=Variovorax paradoxus TaxID=34073 RepID=UPI00278726D1|nr:ADP-ribosylglycohydrolase family protein [Variovorax paradoxus]MDP9928481.1 ADP-ribosyl-[dinitrogen reductase] hydrolase [Variovorax paradoxus]